MSSYGTVITTTQAINDVNLNTYINPTTSSQLTSQIPPGQTLTATGSFTTGGGGGFTGPTGASSGFFCNVGGGGTASISAGTGGQGGRSIFDFTKNYICSNGTILVFDGRGLLAQSPEGALQAATDTGFIIVGADGNDTIMTGALADNVTGALGNDTISTYAGNDTIVTGSGIDTVDGGTGFDVAQVAGAKSGWTATKTAGEVVLVSTTNANNVAHLKNTDFISFTDAVGAQRSIVVSGTEAEGNAMRLYQGIFNRSADQGGAEYWEGMVRGGASTDAIATQFLQSNEFLAVHPTQTNTQYVEMLYTQALGRVADVGGLNYWVGQLDQGASKGAVAVGIIDSTEGIAHIDNVIVLIGTV